MLLYNFHICVSRAAGSLLTPQIAVLPQPCVTAANCSWARGAKDIFVFLHSRQAPPRTSSSPHLQQDCKPHPLPMRWGGAQPVPDSLPIQHRVAEQGCKVINMLEQFVQPRKAVCHTPHAWQVLAGILSGFIPAWGKFKSKFTNLLPLQNHSSSFLSAAQLKWQFILKEQECFIRILPGKSFCSGRWHC